MVLAIKYAINNDKKIKNDFIIQNEIFNNDMIFIELLKYFRVYDSFEKYPQIIVNFIEKKIGFSNITYDLISVSSANILIHELIQNSINFFLQFFIETQKFKFSQYIELLKLVQKSEFDTTILNELLSIHLSNYESFSSNKKKSLLIRFISVIIHILIQKQNFTEIQIITNLFSVNFDMIITHPYDSLPTDLSYILPMILQFNQHKQYETFLVNSMNSDFCSTIFLKSLSTMFIKGNSIDLKKEYFLKLCESNSPSNLSFLFDSLLLITKRPNQQNIVEIIKDCCTRLCGKLPFFSFNFKTSSKISTLTLTLLQLNEQINLPQLFFQTFIFSFLSDTRSSSYLHSLPSLAYLPRSDTSLISHLFTLTFTAPPVIRAISALFSHRALDPAYLNDQLCAFFVRNPSIECALLLSRITLQTRTAARTLRLIADSIPQLSSRFLPALVLIRSLLPVSAASIPLLTARLSASRRLALECLSSAPAASFLYASADTGDTAALGRIVPHFTRTTIPCAYSSSLPTPTQSSAHPTASRSSPPTPSPSPATKCASST